MKTNKVIIISILGIFSWILFSFVQSELSKFQRQYATVGSFSDLHDIPEEDFRVFEYIESKEEFVSIAGNNYLNADKTKLMNVIENWQHSDEDSNFRYYKLEEEKDYVCIVMKEYLKADFFSYKKIILYITYGILLPIITAGIYILFHNYKQQKRTFLYVLFFEIYGFLTFIPMTMGFDIFVFLWGFLFFFSCIFILNLSKIPYVIHTFTILISFISLFSMIIQRERIVLSDIMILKDIIGIFFLVYFFSKMKSQYS